MCVALPSKCVTVPMCSLGPGPVHASFLRPVALRRQKMGSLTSIMSMIPGLSENLIPKGKEKEGQKRLKSFCCMMDSMTDEELDTNKGLEPSRIPRIARGSGTTVKEVEQLMVEHKRFAKMIGKMGKMGGKGGKGLDMAQMQRNPQAMLKNLQGAMDPRMMQQMGGQQGMMNMMKQMGNMDSKYCTNERSVILRVGDSQRAPVRPHASAIARDVRQ